jgi:assimilatory nitrate reductase electron transfer subunit
VTPSLRVVVVGNGMAGSRVVEEIRARDPERRIELTVFGAEPYGAYNRVLLSSVLAGKARVEDIYLAAPTWPGAHGVRLHTGTPVVRIDRDRREVVAADGTVAAYDRLVLATGSVPWLPPIEGLTRPDGTPTPGVTVFRTVDDCHAIVEAAAGARRAVVIGGGLLGLEAARGLVGRGLAVEVVHATDRLMERQLDSGAADVLTRTLGELGVRVRVDARTECLVGGDRVHGVRLDDGTTIGAELVVMACGVRPDVVLARAAGLEVRNGVVVDDTMRSVADPDVFALGECSEHAGQVYGLVAPAWEQAVVVAAHLTGADPAARYTGSRLVTRLKAAGVELAAMGDTQATSDEAEVLSFTDPARGTYKKVVLRDDRVVGAILLGQIDTVGTVTQLFDRGAQAPADRLSLLFAGRGGPAPVENPARIPDRATVCQCNGVTKGAITACVLAGARTLPAVAAATRATTGCGSCAGSVEGIVGWLVAADARPAEVPA